MRRIILLSMLILFGEINQVFSQKPLSNIEIADAIEDQLAFDKTINANKITVLVLNGVVELSGTASDIGAKERATRLAEMVKGVRSVSNLIKVVPPENINDSIIRNNVKKALLYDPATDSYQVSVNVNSGAVTLTGNTESYAEKELCGYVAKSVAGVTSLINKIDVQYKTKRNDMEIKNDILGLLKWNESVNSGLITVDVKNGNVTLGGIVGSAGEKTTATQLSWVAGVKSVDNANLNIEWWAKNADLRSNKNAAVSDEEIKKAIKDAASYDPRVKKFNIEPDVTSGWVTLRGTVENLKAKTAAELIAKNTFGVRGVTNRLKINLDIKAINQQLEDDVIIALALNGAIEDSSIHVKVHNGIVTLTGTVFNYYEKNEAGWIASGVKGVVEVNNWINVINPYGYFWYDNYPFYQWYHPNSNYFFNSVGPNDEAIRKNVQNRLWWSPILDAEHISVVVSNGRVTLTGTVNNKKEMDKAAELAWAGGAWTVDNQLKIKE